MVYQDAFLEYLFHQKRYSEHTIRSYSNDLMQFQNFCDERRESFDVLQTTHRHVKNWLASLLRKKLEHRTINRKLASLRTFFKYLQREGLLQINPVSSIQTLRNPKTVPTFVEKDKINNYLNSAKEEIGFSMQRNLLIVNLLYLTGIRRNELIHLQFQDFDLENCNLKVLGKRNKQRIVPFPQQISEQISNYWQLRNRLFGSAPVFFFLTDKGKKMYPKLVYNVVNTILQSITTIKKKSPHVLRHTYATHMLNNGADLNSIKELLGHANLSATQIYTHTNFEKINSIYKHAHPRA